MASSVGEEYSPYFLVLDQFCVQGLLGKGSFGSVRKAIFLPTGARLALKRISLTRFKDVKMESFNREVQSLSDLKGHPFVVDYHSCFIENNSAYIAMQLMCCNLDEYIQLKFQNTKQKGLGSMETVRLSRQITNGLSFIHDLKIIHRDLKPQNIMLDFFGNAKIGDFGLSRSLTRENTQPLTPNLVTFPYRAPEILLGDPLYGCPVDVWAFGCIFFEMFTGEVLYTADTEIGLLRNIFQTTGFPNDVTWPGVTKLPYLMTGFASKIICNPNFSPEMTSWPSGLEFLKKILVNYPQLRLTSQMLWLDDLMWTPEPEVFVMTKDKAKNGKKPDKETIFTV